MLGLNYIIQDFDRYNLDTLPHSIILLGKEGSGKHVVSNYIGDKFNLNILDISDDLSEDLIENIYRTASPRLYQVDLRKIKDKDQNILLKVFEEPSANVFIILLANNTTSILPTILNRGKIFNIKDYDKKDLKEFSVINNIDIDDKYLGTVINTPGDLLKINSSNIKLNDIKELVDKIINKLNIASFSNTLTIVDKLNFKDEYDKIDVDFFLKLLRYEYLESYKNNNSTFNLYNIVSSELNKLYDSRINKKIFVTSLLITLWKEVRK